MAFQPVADTAQFVVEQTYGTGESVFQNTFYVRNVGAGAWSVGTHLQDTCDAIRDAWVSEMFPLQNVDINSIRVLARDLGTEFGDEATATDATGGTVAGEIAPLALAVGIKLVCDTGSAPRQGRLFLGGFSVANQDFQAWTPTTVSDCVDAVDAIHTAIGGVGFGNAVVRVSRYQTVAGVKTLRDPALTNTLASVSGEVRFWIQRDRRIGIGS